MNTQFLFCQKGIVPCKVHLVVKKLNGESIPHLCIQHKLRPQFTNILSLHEMEIYCRNCSRKQYNLTLHEKLLQLQGLVYPFSK